ncbi:SEC10/PgrA surface exclusion domain-containing protein [Limosilactobacillus vaginalis]|uniref:SEC10/PgrA surface exclusion domain-containing protein n=1 Tax=Limosilactobacillus vaginalis TaxID=1633 RepID=UPI0023599B98|nr:SEC10/PgrA surface exclusion domain-containing protein [Limosilactobacillus vaginalis]WCT59491.1 SEC10/PgrA surface exclusion domain-containing protein [Limosilactobacillus vaginalis]
MRNAQTAQEHGQSILSAAQQRQQAAQSAYDQQLADVQAKQATVDQDQQDLSAAQEQLNAAQSSAGSASSSASTSSSSATSSSASTSGSTSGSSSTSSSASSSTSGSASAGSSATSSSSSASSAATLQQAQAAVRDAQSKQEAAQIAFNQASDDVDAKSTAVDTARQAADQANQKVNTDQNAVKTAQQKVTDLQNASHADVATLQQEVSRLQEKLQNDQQAVTDAQNKLNQAQTGLETAKQAVDNANDDLTKAQQDAKAAQDKLTADQNTAQGKQQAAQSAKETMEQAKAKLDALKNGTASESDPVAQQAPAKVPAGFTDAFAGFNPHAEPTKASQAIQEYVKEAIVDNGSKLNEHFQTTWESTVNGKTTYFVNDNFKHNASDQKELIDIHNLTDSQKEELNEFTANVINRIRKQIAADGGQNITRGYLEVSKGATEIGSQLLTKGYDPSVWRFSQKSHNKNLKYVAKDLGLGEAYVGENVSGSGRNQIDLNPVKPNMDNLKETVYDAIMAMMFYDNIINNVSGPGFGGHTTALLNDPQYNVNTSQGGNAISLDPNGNIIGKQYLNVGVDSEGFIHFNFISDANATPEVKTKLAQGATTPGIDQQSNVSQDDINTAQQDYDQKKVTSDKAEQEAKTALETVENDQAEVKTVSDAVTTAQQKLDSAKKKAQTAQEAVTTKQRKVTDAQAKANATQGQVNEKKAALDAAGKSKDDQAKELNQAKADLQTAQQTLAADQKDQKTKQQAAQNVQSALKKAQETLTAKKSALDNAKKELLSAQDQLNQLEGNKLKNSLAMQLFAQSYAKFAAAIPGEISNLSARVEKLQKKLSNDQAALKDSQKVLATKKTELDAANAALVKTTSDTTIADLKAQLQKDQQQLAQDQATLAKYQQAVKDDLAAFARLQPETTGSQTTDQTIGETGENGSEKVTTQGQKVAGTTTVYRPTNGVAATVAFPVATANSSIAHQQAPSVVISHKAQSRLPQTGDSHNLTALLGLGLAGLAASFGLARKRED